MNIKIQVFLYLFLVTGIMNGQNGLGTIAPHPSSILDLSSTSKGLLLPRMSTEQRDLILNPAKGLVIFNTTKNVLECNFGSKVEVNWSSLLEIATTHNEYDSINGIGDVTTDSIDDDLVPEMILSPSEGSYSVTFESQFNTSKVDSTFVVTTPSFSTPQGVIALQNIYNQLYSKPVTNTTHGAIFGNGETLTPGVYSMPAAVALLQTLTLDGQNNPDSVFVFRIAAAFNIAAGSSILLVNGAKACNVFWVIEAAIVIGANSNIKGMFLSHGAAVGIGANCVIEGRLFSTAAAITTAADIIAMPTDCNAIDLGVLSTFVMFTSIGAITNTAIVTINGDIGANLGAISGFEIATLNGTIYTSLTPVTEINPVVTIVSVNNNNKVRATFGIYQNGVLIPSSTKVLISSANAANISLQAIATIQNGEPIEVRWKTGSDKITMGNRSLTLIKIP